MKHLLTGSLIALALAVALPVAAADNTKPVVGAPTPITAAVGFAVNVTASVSDADSGIASCSLYLEFMNVGPMNVMAGVASRTQVFTEPGVYTMFVFCRDVAGNFTSGPNVSVVVSASGGSGGSVPLSVGPVTPVAATAGVPVTISAPVAGPVLNCTLVVDAVERGIMPISSGTASTSHLFQNPGTYAVHAHCASAGGAVAIGQDVTVTVTAPVASPFGARLIKLACPPNAGPFDACRSVYYQGVDGKRHAFPSDKVYFSWYADFSGIQTVDGAALAAIPLGANVTYRPGVKLVKFESVNKVYAVSRGGVLRWIMSESAARELYGADWATKVNDVSDAFFGNYAFGADIAAAGDYAPAAETAATATIDANVR